MLAALAPPSAPAPGPFRDPLATMANSGVSRCIKNRTPSWDPAEDNADPGDGGVDAGNNVSTTSTTLALVLKISGARTSYRLAQRTTFSILLVVVGLISN